MKEAKYRIGYIDEDSDQVKKYKRRFKKYDIEIIGYEFRKGMTLGELMNQVYESDIDLLMIDYKLNESNMVTFNGEEVESEIYDKKPLFPHIIFTNKVDQAEPYVEDWMKIFDKEEIFPEEGEEDKVKRFITKLSKSIEQYRNHIKKKKDIVAQLLEKREKEGLTASEKDLLITTQEYLNSLDESGKKEIPKQLLKGGNLEDLTEVRKEAEEFLKSLIADRKNS